MLAVNYPELRGNMKEYMDKVSDDYIYWKTEDRKTLKRTISRRSLRILESQNQGEGSIEL